ncbi:ribbon-helix-helix domain-containing protein [Niveispirillum irakense]|uniref:ribbon-helix-helix domain-containing protein n=1 Tax=Niveispirillum irakense TaxID=34011 RepID=UPI000401F296|nr:ribbon-helix-helix domain-containing protein [Niveispirillum irakense]
MAAKRRPPSNPDDTAPESMRAVCRNVVVGGRRTSVRMEPLLWESLADICRREGHNINDIVTMIDGRRGDSALTAALRIFILSYFRTASEPAGPVTGMAEEQAHFGTAADFSPVFQRALGVFDED